MKKIITYSIIAIFISILFTSCKKDKVYDQSEHWLSQERGVVVYSNDYCAFYILETDFGYTIIQNRDGLRTYDGDIMYGNFGGYGSRDFYNYSANIVTRGDVVDYDLSYFEAQDAIDYYCPFGKPGGSKIRKSEGVQSKIPRTAAPVNQ